MNMEINFYEKIRKQYQKAAKPFIYEFSLTGQQPKQKKFRIILVKLIEILNKDMKNKYLQQQTNYWYELQTNMGDTIEMAFIKSMFQEIKKKQLIYFALLLHNKKLFKTFQLIFARLPYLYKDVQAKIQQFNKDINEFMFLNDGQFIVESKYIKDFNQFREEERLKEINFQNDIKYVMQNMVLQIQNYFLQIKRKEEEEQEKKRLQQRQKQRRILQAQQKQKIKAMKRQQIIRRQNQQKINPKSQNKSSITKNISNNSPYKELIRQTKVQTNKKKPKHIKNSQVLFNQKYKDQLQVFSYRLKPTKIGDKEFCFQCKQKLGHGLFFIGANINFCEYTGQYYCNQHIAEERISIPYKAKQEFDLRGYSVSIDSLSQIKCWYDKPLIQIKNDDPVVKKHQKLYEFLVFKRQLHLMYDTICNSELVDKMFGNKINYCLKDNHFSLKNLYDIYNGLEISNFQRQFQILTKHFYSCQTCQDRKGRICHICNHPPKIFAFEIRQTYSCLSCMKISHRRCLTKNKCPCQETPH